MGKPDPTLIELGNIFKDYNNFIRLSWPQLTQFPSHAMMHLLLFFSFRSYYEF